MPPKKAPAKETPGKPGKTAKTNKGFVWSDDEVQLLLETAAELSVVF